MPISKPPPARQDRRKERTRAALMEAAHHFIAEGEDTHTSIQAITERADVGFGSFYNYFSSKEELFEAVVASTVEEYFGWLDEHLPTNDDPAERLMESVRLTGRLAIDQPAIAAILTRRVSLLGNAEDQRGQRIRADIRAVLAANGGAPESLEGDILVTAALGSIMAVLRRTITLSPAEIVDAADVLGPAVLRLLANS